MALPPEQLLGGRWKELTNVIRLRRISPLAALLLLACGRASFEPRQLPDVDTEVLERLRWGSRCDDAAELLEREGVRLWRSISTDALLELRWEDPPRRRIEMIWLTPALGHPR